MCHSGVKAYSHLDPYFPADYLNTVLLGCLCPLFSHSSSFFVEPVLPLDGVLYSSSTLRQVSDSMDVDEASRGYDTGV